MNEPEYIGRSVRIPLLVGPLHTGEGDDLPPLDASDLRFGTGIRVVEIPVCSCRKHARCLACIEADGKTKPQ